MASRVPQEPRTRKKTRFGCRNCKLRKVKCDETRPQCQRCQDYGVVCNFAALGSDFQVSARRFQCRRVEKKDQLGFCSSIPRPFSLRAVCSDGLVSFDMDAQCMMRLDRFRMRTVHSYMAEMMKIWQDRIPHVAFRNPYLMHTMLAVAAAHQRCQDMPAGSHRTTTEIHHASQCVLLFNRKLSRPIEFLDRDPLWATAALLGTLTMASFDATTAEEAWPLRPSNPSDLEWFRLSEGKKTIWNLTDPLRPGGVFRSMGHEYAQMHCELPLLGAEGVPVTLAEVCNLSASCNQDNNPYFVAAHLLVRSQRLSDSGSADIRLVSFVSQSQPSFRDLLLEKDPVALLLLSLWYWEAGQALWWMKQRARVESQAIHLYLERFHRDNVRVLRLLPLFPDCDA